MRVLLFLSLVFGPSLVAAPLRPNILWLTAEDHGPHLGCYGDAYARTPQLDAFAKRSLRYTKASSTAPICAPARTTLITGMYAPALGARILRDNILFQYNDVTRRTGTDPDTTALLGCTVLVDNVARYRNAAVVRENPSAIRCSVGGDRVVAKGVDRHKFFEVKQAHPAVSCCLGLADDDHEQGIVVLWKSEDFAELFGVKTDHRA